MTYIDYHRRYHKLCFDYPEKNTLLWLMCSPLSIGQIIPKGMNLSFCHSTTAPQHPKINLVAVIRAALPTNYSNSDSTTTQRYMYIHAAGSTTVQSSSHDRRCPTRRDYTRFTIAEVAKMRERHEGTERIEAASYAKKHALMISAGLYTHCKGSFTKEH